MRTEKVGSVSERQVRQIAETKMPDLNAVDIDGAMAQVRGTARSMGIERRRRRRSGRQEVRRRRRRSLRPRASSPRRPRRSTLLEAFDPTRKFDETVEVAIRLGVDPRKADQMIRGTVSLPNGTGKSARVIVFAAG